MRRQTSQRTDVGPVVRRLAGYLRQVRGKFILSLIFMLTSSGLTAAKAWIIQPTVDTFLDRPGDDTQLRMLCAIVLIIFVAHGASIWLFAVSERMVSAEVTRRIRSDLFAHLQAQSLGYYARTPSSELMSRVIHDVSVFESSALSAMLAFFRNAVTLALLLGIVLVQNIAWGIMLLVAMVTVGFALRYMSGRIVDIARRAQDRLAGLTRHLSEITAGIAVILGFGVQDHWQQDFSKSSQRYYELQVETIRIRGCAVALLEALFGVALAAIFFWMGSALLEGTLSAGQLLSFIAVMFLVQAPAQRMTQSVAGLSQGFAAGARAFEIFEEEPPIRDPQNARKLPPQGGHLEFRNVSFGYGGCQVIEDLSFEIASGEFAVLAGRSGAGKSTVTRLAQRFYDPLCGQVLVDGIDIRELRRQDLCRAVSYVAQDVFLFDDTVRFNLVIGKPDATAADLDRVIALACLDDVIAALPHGIDSAVGERGELLSGGQRQRIAIARALLTDARILILDEATSALDMELEQRLFENLGELRSSRSILAITHRLTMADLADRVLVLRDGRLVEEGLSKSLVAAGGEFSRLQQQQCI